MSRHSTYDKYPTVAITSSFSDCAVGWESVVERLKGRAPRVLCVECYPGVHVDEIELALASGLRLAKIFRASEAMKPAAELEALLASFLTDDPVFGRLNGLRIEDFMDPRKLA